MSCSVDFSQKCLVIVTGASKGIGQTIAIEISKQINKNSVFLLLARSEIGLEETKAKILNVANTFKVFNCETDLSKPDNETFKSALASIDSSGIEIGLIFHNAGAIGMLKEATQLSDLQYWRQYYDLNLFSTVLLNNTILKRFKSLISKLVIVNITSLCARQPVSNLAMYGSVKTAREMFFKVMALEEKDVVVLNYSPGPVKTDMFDTVCETADSVEIKNTFQEIRETSALTTDQTVSKLLSILKEGNYKSGDVIDYFD